uniref:Pre-mRNA-splicing factor 3 domain-containing protein n=1 Tax=Sexangularia sp. CB-2014 TaxID=1486929 RepID=A0A7S1VRB6_9EUKA
MHPLVSTMMGTIQVPPPCPSQQSSVKSVQSIVSLPLSQEEQRKIRRKIKQEAEQTRRKLSLLHGQQSDSASSSLVPASTRLRPGNLARVAAHLRSVDPTALEQAMREQQQQRRSAREDEAAREAAARAAVDGTAAKAAARAAVMSSLSPLVTISRSSSPPPHAVSFVCMATRDCMHPRRLASLRRIAASLSLYLTLIQGPTCALLHAVSSQAAIATACTKLPSVKFWKEDVLQQVPQQAGSAPSEDGERSVGRRIRWYESVWKTLRHKEQQDRTARGGSGNSSGGGANANASVDSSAAGGVWTVGVGKVASIVSDGEEGSPAVGVLGTVTLRFGETEALAAAAAAALGLAADWHAVHHFFAQREQAS